MSLEQYREAMARNHGKAIGICRWLALIAENPSERTVSMAIEISREIVGEFERIANPEHRVEVRIATPSVSDVVLSDAGERAVHDIIQRKNANQSTDDGWIEWNGGECPVPEGTPVCVRYRDGSTESEALAGIVGKGAVRWTHIGSPGDIIAYRLHTPKIEGTENEGSDHD